MIPVGILGAATPRAGGAAPGGAAPGWNRFNATGAEQEIVVPDGVSSCAAHVIGASGGGGCGLYTGPYRSGAGGYSEGSFSVTPGQILKVRVGVRGQGGKRESPSYGGLGGYPGGGSGAFGDAYCGGGGGYSGVFDNSGNPIIMAGGGGGGSGYASGAGAGGGTNGQNSSAAGGGTQVAGGTGTYPGSAYQGGNADGGNRTTATSNDCGGGGGGYYGGGAPSGDANNGAGGSGYIDGAVTGNTYAGNFGVRPTEVPATINGESTAGIGEGSPTITSAELIAPDGSDGAVWLHFA